VEKVLDYDYAPVSCLVEGRRGYFNISQEGNSDIDLLREEKLVNGLKLSAKDYQPVTCYQISEKGDQLVKHIGKVDREAVHECIFPPQTRDLLNVHWNGKRYSLRSENGYKRVSEVTDHEDVSYVSSGYIPQCLRTGGRPTMSNAHRAHECRPTEGSDGNLRDDLNEIITLNSVSLIVAEFIPCGVNQIVALNTNLGSDERVQGGFFTATIDTDSAGTKLEVAPGLTNVSVLDYSATRHLNFEADIHFPEDEGVVQVETFGCSLNAIGTMFYGMQVEAILARIKDQMSLDHLSRVLVDVHIDSSKIVDSIISQYQRDLLQLIFDGDAGHRDKVNLILANEINPHLTAEEYMDKGEYENELKQVLGDTRAAYDISEHDTLVFGAHGILVAGANSRHYEPLLVAYLQFTSMDLFVRNFFNRIFIVQGRMMALEQKILASHESPKSFGLIKEEIGFLSRDSIFLMEILGYLNEAIGMLAVPPEPPEQSGRALYERLRIQDVKNELVVRVTDIRKLMVGTQHTLDVLKQMAKHVSENRMLGLRESIGNNTKEMCSLHASSTKQYETLEIMQVIIGGVLAFDIMERITGEWSVVNAEAMRWFVEPMLRQLPAVWFLLNLAAWALVAYVVHRYLMRRVRLTGGTITLRQRWRVPCSLTAIHEVLAMKDPDGEERFCDDNNSITRVSWTEKDKNSWGGFAPRVTLEYDAQCGYLLSTTLEYNRRQANKTLGFNAKDLKKHLREVLLDLGIVKLEDLRVADEEEEEEELEDDDM